MMDGQAGKSIKKKTIAVKTAESWWVRNDLSSQYGPVDFRTLQQWTKEGRVSPSGEISTDGKIWEPAISNPLLEMEWLVVFPDGHFYGPVHLDVLKELKKGDLWVAGTVSYRQTDPKSLRGNPLQKRVNELERELLQLEKRHQKELEKQSELSRKELQKELDRKDAAVKKESQKQIEAFQRQEAVWADAAKRWKEYESATRGEIAALSTRLKQADADLAREQSRTAQRLQEAEVHLQQERDRFGEHLQDLQNQIAVVKERLEESQRQIQADQAREREENLRIKALQDEIDQANQLVQRQKTRLEENEQILHAKDLQIQILKKQYDSLQSEERELESRLAETEAALLEERTLGTQDRQGTEAPSAEEPSSGQKTRETLSEPIILDAEIVSEEVEDSACSAPPETDKKAKVFEVGEKLFSKMKQTAAETFRKRGKPSGTDFPFAGKDQGSLEALEQQLQRELSRLGKNSTDLFK